MTEETSFPLHCTLSRNWFLVTLETLHTRRENGLMVEGDLLFGYLTQGRVAPGALGFSFTYRLSLEMTGKTGCRAYTDMFGLGYL